MSEKKSNFDQQGILMAIKMAVTAKPELLNFFPQLMSILDMVEKGIDDNLDDGRMICAFNHGGQARLLILDRTTDFTIDNKGEVKVTPGQSPVVKALSKNQLKKDLFESDVYLTLKEMYERAVQSGSVNPNASPEMPDFLKGITGMISSPEDMKVLPE